MTTRLYAADGTALLDIDEETECLATTHVNDVPVFRTEYIGPTPPKPKKAVDPAIRRAELLAELDALGEFTPEPQAPSAPPPHAAPAPVRDQHQAEPVRDQHQAELTALHARIAALEAATAAPIEDVVQQAEQRAVRAEG